MGSVSGSITQAVMTSVSDTTDTGRLLSSTATAQQRKAQRNGICVMWKHTATKAITNRQETGSTRRSLHIKRRRNREQQTKNKQRKLTETLFSSTTPAWHMAHV